jgi:hypothetical protein
VVIELPIEPQHAKSGAVIHGGVLKIALPIDPDKFHVDLSGISRLILLKQQQ